MFTGFQVIQSSIVDLRGKKIASDTNMPSLELAVYRHTALLQSFPCFIKAATNSSHCQSGYWCIFQLISEIVRDFISPVNSKMCWSGWRWVTREHKMITHHPSVMLLLAYWSVPLNTIDCNRDHSSLIWFFVSSQRPRWCLFFYPKILNLQWQKTEKQ